MSNEYPDGANPDICWHRVLYHVVEHPVTEASTKLILCISCSSTISAEYWLEHIYDYSNESDVWIERPDETKERRMSERKFEFVRTEWPAIFKFDGTYFEESFNTNTGEARFVEVSAEYVERKLKE